MKIATILTKGQKGKELLESALARSGLVFMTRGVEDRPEDNFIAVYCSEEDMRKPYPEGETGR